jgi:16S rRNA processing protein RimM
VIRVGQVTGAYGLQGAVKVVPLTEFEDRFSPGACLLLDGSERHVEWSREGHPGLVVKLKGIDSRTMADLFRGRYLEVGEEASRPAPEGRFYHHQLVGLKVLTKSGRALGEIAEVLERPANDVWVSREGRVQHLIPARPDALVAGPHARRQVVVSDWLLEHEDA